MLRILFLSLACLVMTPALKAQTDSLPVAVSESARAEFMADSTAKAELKQYQKEHRGLSRGQLSLADYDRTLNENMKGQNGYYMFDYDYNKPLGGFMYMLHFSVTVNVKTGSTVFRSIEKQ